VLLLLVHVPPDVASLKVIDEPGQTCVDPVITAGNGFTVTTVLTWHPVDVKVKVMGAVPDEEPVVTPVEEPIDATLLFPLTHVPAPDASVSVIDELTQKGVLLPGMAGGGETVTILVAGVPHEGV